MSRESSAASSLGLDVDRAKIYCDLIFNSLGEAARQALKKMDARTYEYQSDFARQYIAQGRAEGEAAMILRQLAFRFGVLETEVQNRIRRASIPGFGYGAPAAASSLS